MRAALTFFLFYLQFGLVIFQELGFNIDTSNTIIYLDQSKFIDNVKPSNITSYFGFSLLLIPGDDTQSSWLQVGAPRSNSPSLKFKNPGIIFTCTIPKPCKYIEIDKGENRNILDDAWIGASMDVSLKYNRTVVCAPRWVHMGFNDYKMRGACYWSYLKSKHYYKKKPLENDFNDVLEVEGTNVYNWAQGEAGLSVHIPEDKKEMFIGAPGVYNWKGTTMVYKDAKNNISPSKYTQYSKQQILDEDPAAIFNHFDIADPTATKDINVFSYYGYAVTSGRFYSEETFYVGGAPRSGYYGQVLVSSSGGKLNIKETKKGTQFGEYFGAALAAGDINRDGFDDLFVGSPFYRGSAFNEGRMYLYLGSPKGKLEEPVNDKFIDGKYANGQFGSAITFLGDINRDENRYVAVSAPYAEEGSGIVYIYKGSGRSSGFSLKPVQVIKGKSFLPDIRGFGLAISKPADIDGNGYKDIAIGAYQSGHVVILRSRPLVVLVTYFSQVPETISNDMIESSKPIPFVICHEYISHGGMDTIDISRRIEVDENIGRAYLDRGTKTKVLKLTRGKPECEALTIKLRSPLHNKYDSLTLAANISFIEVRPKPSKLLVTNSSLETQDNFCLRCGVYDKFRSNSTVKRSIPFVLGCGNDNVCQSKLSFNASFIISGKRNNTFIRGSTNEIDLVIDVRNDGENAYNLLVQVDLPEELSFKIKPTLCDQNKNRMTCQLANPLEKGMNKTLYPLLKLDMDYINKKNLEDFLNINITLLTVSQTKNPVTQMVKLNLATEADILISGNSGEQSYTYGNASNSMVEFMQIYTITKFGSSLVNSVEFQIDVPYAIKTDTNNISFISMNKPVGFLNGQSLDIRSQWLNLIAEELKKEEMDTMNYNSRIMVDYSNLQNITDSEFLGTTPYEINCAREDVLCGRIYGRAGPFEVRKNSAILQLQFFFDIKNIRGFLPKNAVIRYSTTGIIEIKDPQNLTQSGMRPDIAIVSSIFFNDSSKRIDLWIIIGSALIGFLLLLIFTFGLTKAGFFKRTRKEELEQMKAQTGHENGNMDTTDVPTDE